jgi:hypothetical protein
LKEKIHELKKKQQQRMAEQIVVPDGQWQLEQQRMEEHHQLEEQRIMDEQQQLEQQHQWKSMRRLWKSNVLSNNVK